MKRWLCAILIPVFAGACSPAPRCVRYEDKIVKEHECHHQNPDDPCQWRLESRTERVCAEWEK